MESVITDDYNYDKLIVKRNAKDNKIFVYIPSECVTSVSNEMNFYNFEFSGDKIIPWTFCSNLLREASRYGNFYSVLDLINNGIDVNEADEYGNTPLWLAYTRNNYKIVVELINAGADMNIKTGDLAISDIHRACGWGSASFVKFLINCGGQVNLLDIFGKTPLIFSVDYQRLKYDSIQLIKILISNGANVNHQDMSGLTALHYASLRGKLSFVEELLMYNADPCILNQINFSPLTYTLCFISFLQSYDESYKNRVEIVKLLIKSIDIAKIKFTIIGREIPNLVALFNFIMFGLSQKLDDIQNLGWSIFEEILSKPVNSSIIDEQLLCVTQNLLMFNNNLSYLIYFLQRINLKKLNELLSYYFTSINYNENQLHVNFLIIYSILIDDGQTLKTFINEQFEYSFENERFFAIIQLLIQEKSHKPFSLKCLCRRTLRKNSEYLSVSFLKELYLPTSLVNYMFYDELNSFMYKKSWSLNDLLDFLNKI